MLHRLSALLALAICVGCGGGVDRQPAAPVRPPMAQVESDSQPAASGTDEVPGRGFNQQDLDRIEQELQIKLPAEYREFMLTRSAELLKYTYPLRGETRWWFDSYFFAFDIKRLISENADQRQPDMAAGDTFPGWWKEYFFVGTNGGGDYYAIRLDGKPGVWFLACDGGTIRKWAASLDDYVAKCLEDYETELKQYRQLEEVHQAHARGEIDEAEFNRRWKEILDSSM
jgi:hypothetical protein